MQLTAGLSTHTTGDAVRISSGSGTERRRAGKRRIELTLREICFFSYQNRKCEELFVFRDGGEGEPTGRECQRELVIRSGPIGLRQRGGHEER